MFELDKEKLLKLSTIGFLVAIGINFLIMIIKFDNPGDTGRRFLASLAVTGASVATLGLLLAYVHRKLLEDEKGPVSWAYSFVVISFFFALLFLLAGGAIMGR